MLRTLRLTESLRAVAIGVARKAAAIGTSKPVIWAAKTGAKAFVIGLAGSAEADRFKARLDAQGFASSIQTVTINGKTYYRVRTGPYKGKEATAKAKSDLTSKGHQAIMVKVK